MKTIIINSPKFGQHKVLVDNDDYKYLKQFKWNLSNGYCCRNIWNKKTKTSSIIHIQREILKTPKNKTVAFKDHNCLNCQKNNIKNCSVRGRNKRSSKYSSSKYVGVSFVTRKMKYIKNDGTTSINIYKLWRASIKLKNRNKFLGHFPYTKEGEILAAKCRDKSSKKYFGEFASLNIID